MRSFALLSVMMTVVLVACGGGGDDDGIDVMVPPIDSGPTVDAEEPDSSMPPGDGNDSFNDAVDLIIDAPGADEGIRTPGDHDFYRFTATQGQWLVVFTTANPMDDPDMLDTVITMYGPDSTSVQVAENDDAVPRRNTDSEIVIRIPADGVYYLEIQDFTDWDGSGIPEFGPTYDYTIAVATLNPTFIEAATDPGNDVLSATTITPPTLMASKFDSGTDIDVYSITLTTDSLLEVSAMPDGPTGYGSTVDIGNMWVTDQTGAIIIGRVNATMGPFDGPFQVMPFLTAGTYMIHFEHATGTAGANDFFVGKAFTAGENPRERETVVGENDTILTSMMSGENITMDPSGTGTVGFLYSELSTAVDVDYWGFPVPAGQNVTVRCSSARVGSGVQGLTVQLRRSDDSTVAMDTESMVDGVNIVNAAVGSAGTYYVRLSKTGQDAQVTGTYLRCVVFTFVP